MARSILLLGSNLGDRKEILEKVKIRINSEAGKIIKTSSIYESEAWGFEAENSFLNQAIVIETEMNPGQLLPALLKIEKGLGRIRSAGEYESRLIDIDILFYEDEIINEKDLVVPHARIQDRMFVLKPLKEISENLIHPVFNKSINNLFDNCKDNLKVEIFQKSNNA